MIFVVLALVAIILLIPLLGLDYQLKRIVHFQRRRVKHSSATTLLPIFQETQKRKLKVPLTDVRDFVITLQLGTSMQATLTGSLDRAAKQFANRGIFGERLQRQVEARLSSMSPEAVLEGLVEDFDCPQLADVLERVRMASSGGVSYHRVLGVSASAIENDIRSEIEKEIQRAPIRLTLPMVAGVFFPALILGLIPLMLAAVQQMGMGVR